MANYRKRLLTDSPTGPSFSTARRRDSKTSATLEKPLARESLVNPDDFFRRRRAVAYLPYGRLAYRGSMQIGQMRRLHATSPNPTVAPTSEWCQQKAYKTMKLFFVSPNPSCTAASIGVSPSHPGSRVFVKHLANSGTQTGLVNNLGTWANSRALGRPTQRLGGESIRDRMSACSKCWSVVSTSLLLVRVTADCHAMAWEWY